MSIYLSSFVLLFMMGCLCRKVMIFPLLLFYVSGILCAHSVISLAWPWPGHTTPSEKSPYATAKNIRPYGQYHCMPRAIASYAIGKIIACQSRTAGSPVKKQWWRLRPPPLLHIFRPACRRRGRRLFHLSQRDFLHRAADLYDIDTVRQAADDSICAAIHTPATGGIHLDLRRRCRAVCAVDAYRAANHLNYHF